MIDFDSSTIIKLKMINPQSVADVVNPLLIVNEQIISAYKSVRDCVIFTDKRIIAINTQGITGKKKDFTSLPYSKISVYSVETAGVLDTDCELEMYFSGLGKVKFEFSGQSNIVQIGQLISSFALK